MSPDPPSPKAQLLSRSCVDRACRHNARVVLRVYLVAEWIHCTLSGRILPPIKLNVYTFWGL